MEDKKIENSDNSLWKLEYRLERARQLERAAQNAIRDWDDDGQKAAERYREEAKSLKRKQDSYD